MLGQLLDVVLDLADTCGPCSGGSPASPTWAGAGGAGGAGAPGGEPSPPRDPEYDPRQPDQPERGEPERGRPPRDPRDPQEPEQERPFHERPGHEGRLQRDQARETIANLLWEAGTSGAGNLGSVTGPLITVALATDTLADGVSTVLEADRIREERIDDQTGGYFTNGAGERVAEPPAPGDKGGRGDRSSQEPPRRERDPYVERVMEDIQIKQQFEDAGNKGWDGWKDWR